MWKITNWIIIHTIERKYNYSVYDPNLKINIINLKSSHLKAGGKHVAQKKW
jgi:hypothetical protein